MTTTTLQRLVKKFRRDLTEDEVIECMECDNAPAPFAEGRWEVGAAEDWLVECLFYKLKDAAIESQGVTLGNFTSLRDTVAARLATVRGQ